MHSLRHDGICILMILWGISLSIILKLYFACVGSCFPSYWDSPNYMVPVTCHLASSQGPYLWTQMLYWHDFNHAYFQTSHYMQEMGSFMDQILCSCIEPLWLTAPTEICISRDNSWKEGMWDRKNNNNNSPWGNELPECTLVPFFVLIPRDVMNSVNMYLVLLRNSGVFLDQSSLVKIHCSFLASVLSSRTKPALIHTCVFKMQPCD